MFNKKTSIILAITSPIIVFLLSVGYIQKFYQITWFNREGYLQSQLPWYHIQETWPIWIVAIGLITIIEIFIFRNPEK